jgi:GNAT superfamily N-acetyltransferase
MSVSEVEIGPATEADAPALNALLQTLFAAEAEFTTDPEAHACGIAMILADPAIGQFLVARQGGRVVGMVGLLFTVSTALGARVALLEDMVVAPEARDLKIGSRLIDAAIAAARAAGCRRITLLTDGANEGGHRFYARNGFARSEMVPFRMLL